MEKTYQITREQFEQIRHFKTMFELNADYIADLCSSEKSDIVYGFELGKIYGYLREHFSNMMVLEEEIIENNS
jgi:hypothetical protein